MFEEFSNLPENFLDRDIKTGDFYGDVSERYTALRAVVNTFSGSLISHAGMFVWVDYQEYEKNKKVKIVYDNKEKAILCVLHQVILGNKGKYNMLSGERTYGLLLEPIVHVLKRASVIYFRNLNRKIKEEYIIEKISNLLENSKKYSTPGDFSILISIITGFTDLNTKKGFTCSHLICAIYVDLFNYPYGPLDLKRENNNFKIPKFGYSVYQPRDFLHDANSSPLFEDKKEFIVYKTINVIEYIFFNPTTISLILIILLIIAIVLIYYFYNSKNHIFSTSSKYTSSK